MSTALVFASVKDATKSPLSKLGQDVELASEANVGRIHCYTLYDAGQFPSALQALAIRLAKS
jgi:hypothetical protein